MNELLNTSIARAWDRTASTPAGPVAPALSDWPTAETDGDAANPVEMVALRDYDQLLAENLAKDEVLGLIAHELRNPLNGVLLAARRLLGAGMVTAEELPTVEYIISGATRMTALLENMLVLSRDSGPELEPVLLQRLLPIAARQHELRYPERCLLLDIPPDLSPVEGYGGWIAQIMENFIGNAEKYSPVNLPISIVAAADNEYVSTRILDQGAGIIAEHAARLFSPFHRELSTIDLPGLGLGLTVCKRMVEVQGGNVWAASRPDGGSEFGFTLRIAH